MAKVSKIDAVSAILFLGLNTSVATCFLENAMGVAHLKRLTRFDLAQLLLVFLFYLYLARARTLTRLSRNLALLISLLIAVWVSTTSFGVFLSVRCYVGLGISAVSVYLLLKLRGAE